VPSVHQFGSRRLPPLTRRTRRRSPRGSTGIIASDIFTRIQLGWTEWWDIARANGLESHPVWPGLLNTYILLASSFTVVLALAYAKRGSRRGTVGFLSVTFLGACLFLLNKGNRVGQNLLPLRLDVRFGSGCDGVLRDDGPARRPCHRRHAHHAVPDRLGVQRCLLQRGRKCRHAGVLRAVLALRRHRLAAPPSAVLYHVASGPTGLFAVFLAVHR